MEVRLAEHASDSGQGASDEDLRSQSQPPPVINLVQRESSPPASKVELD